MVSVVSFLTLILACALPSAFAASPPPKLCLPKRTVEVFSKTLPPKSSFVADGTADAYGENTYTYVKQALFQLPGFNDYTAYLGGSTDKGEVYVYNNGNGKALDCDKIWEYQYILQNTGRKNCYYEVEFRSRKACEVAQAYFDGAAYATGGNASANLSVYSIQYTQFSATSQYLTASGSTSAGGYLWNSEYVKSKNGSYNSATASATVDCFAADASGGCTVFAYTVTTVDDDSSSSGGGVIGTAGRKLL